jgi:hypothetical protein
LKSGFLIFASQQIAKANQAWASKRNAQTFVLPPAPNKPAPKIVAPKPSAPAPLSLTPEAKQQTHTLSAGASRPETSRRNALSFGMMTSVRRVVRTWSHPGRLKNVAFGIALAIVAVLFIHLYRTALRENRALCNFALLILLDETVYVTQRKGLTDLVRSIDAKGAGELGGKIYLATNQLALRLSGNSLGTAGLLWKLRERSGER